MWLATKLGFYSVVLKDGHYHIRARREADLRALLDANPDPLDYPIETWPSADYRYRIRIPEADPAFSEIMATLVTSVDYANFKNEIAANPDQRHKLHAYHQIWSIMAAEQK